MVCTLLERLFKNCNTSTFVNFSLSFLKSFLRSHQKCNLTVDISKEGNAWQAANGDIYLAYPWGSANDEAHGEENIISASKNGHNGYSKIAGGNSITFVLNKGFIPACDEKCKTKLTRCGASDAFEQGMRPSMSEGFPRDYWNATSKSSRQEKSQHGKIYG